MSDYFESTTAPHEALGRAARKLANGGALYLGGGIGVEKRRGQGGAESYGLTGVAKTQALPGPLGAAVAAFTAAGQSTALDSPGGGAKIADPAVAARLREIQEIVESRQRSLVELRASLKRQRERAAAEPFSYVGSPVADERWERNRVVELGAQIAQMLAERARLIAAATGGVREVLVALAWDGALAEMCLPDDEQVAESAKTAGYSVKHKDLSTPGGRKNWVEKAGRLPAYIQNIAAALIREGKAKSAAIAIAISRVKAWASGRGGVSPEVKAASGKAVAEWEALKAKSKVRESVLVEQAAESFVTFDESKHKRGAKGTAQGGKFVASGSSGTQVRTIQHKLGVTTDGKFGAATAAAVRAYQAKHGLQVDGVVGRQTAAALAGAKGASKVRPGSLTKADTNELAKLRSSQVRHRSQAEARAERRPAERKPLEDEKGYNWRTQGNGKRKVKLKDGSERVVDGKAYDRLKADGKLREGELEEDFAESKIRRSFNGRFADKPDVLSLGAPARRPGPSLPGNPKAGGARPKAQLFSQPLKPVPRRGNPARGRVQKRQLGEDELPDYVGKGAWSAAVPKAIEEIAAGKHGRDGTLSAHTLPNGQLAPERKKLHDRIVELSMRHAQEHPGEDRAIFLSGGAASGKSSVLKSGLIDVPPDAVVVNPDIVRKLLPEYAELQRRDYTTAAAHTHEEASMLSKRIHAMAAKASMHVIVDGVGGGEPGKFAKKVAEAAKRSSSVEVVHVTIPLEEAMKREQKRALRTKRKVLDEQIRKGHRESTAAIPEVAQIEGVRVRVVDNNTGGAPELIAESKAREKKLRVLDAERHRLFVEKAQAKTRE